MNINAGKIWPLAKDAIVGMIFAVPFIIFFYPRTNKFDFIDSFTPMFVIGIIVCAGLIMSMIKRDRQASMPIALAFFVLWTAVSFFVSEIRMFGFAEVFMLFVTAILFLFFSSPDVQPTMRKLLTPALAGLLLLTAIWGIYGYLTTDHSRFFGLFYDPSIKANAWPNAYATFFLMTFPFAVNFVVARKKIGTLLMIVLGFLLATFYLTYSRAGYIAFVIELAIFVYLMRPFDWRKIWQKLLIVILSAIIFAFGIHMVKVRYGFSAEQINVSQRLSFNEEIGGTSFTERFQFFSGSLKLIMQKPFFGSGPMSFKWAYPQVQKGFLAISDHPHNIFLKYAVERGLPAAILFAIFLIFLFIKANPFSKESTVFNKIAWIAILGSLAHMMVDYNFNFVTNEIILWILLSAVAIPKVRKVNITGIILVVIILITGSLVILQSREYNGIVANPTAENINNYSPLIPRWAFYQIYDVINKNDSKLMEAVLKRQLSINSLDTITMERLAFLYSDLGMNAEAKNEYEAILKINPKNTFKYYLDYASLLIKMNQRDELKALLDKVRPLIDEYKGLFEKNVHYTRSTDEMKYVQRLEALKK